jgi:hypothetical protein
LPKTSKPVVGASRRGDGDLGVDMAMETFLECIRLIEYLVFAKRLGKYVVFAVRCI